MLTITSTSRPATDLGFLLHKHPDRLHTVDVAFGDAHVFHVKASIAPLSWVGGEVVLRSPFEPIGTVDPEVGAPT